MFLCVYCGLGSFYTIAPESFINTVRGTGMAYINITARLGGILTPIVTGILLEMNNGVQITVVMYAFFYAVVAVFVFFVPETKVKVKTKPLIT
jgi:MFS family permease